MVADCQGSLVTGTFMDSLGPTSMELPPIETVHLEFPSPRNPLGIKGIGEGGAISPPAAIANAVEDALAPFGVRVTRTPLGPSTVLGLIAEAEERRGHGTSGGTATGAGGTASAGPGADGAGGAASAGAASAAPGVGGSARTAARQSSQGPGARGGASA